LSNPIRQSLKGFLASAYPSCKSDPLQYCHCGESGRGQHAHGLTNIALGLAFSAFNYAYAPFQLVGGWFADRFGARRT
jgi:MFS family permease